MWQFKEKKGVAASEQYLSAVDLAAACLPPCHAGFHAELLLPTDLQPAIVRARRLAATAMAPCPVEIKGCGGGGCVPWPVWLVDSPPRRN
jgi:hypothetical protein